MAWRFEPDEAFARLFKRVVEQKHKKSLYDEIVDQLTFRPDQRSKANHPLDPGRPPFFPWANVWQYETSHGYRVFFRTESDEEVDSQGRSIPFFIGGPKGPEDTTESMYNRVVEMGDDD